MIQDCLQQDLLLCKQRTRLWLRILACSRSTEKILRHRFRADFNSTLARFDVMAALERDRDGLRMSEISNKLRVSNGNVTGIVERLVRDGLIARQTAIDDKRASVIKLTEAGFEAFFIMASEHERWINECFGALTEVEVEQMIVLLSRLRESKNDG